MATVLALGILSIPVNCALAAGPHSIFQTPTIMTDASGVFVIVHHHPIAPPADSPALSFGRPHANQLPSPTTAISVMVAVADAEAPLQLPHSLPAPGIAPEAPLERSLMPEAPPPRA